MSDSADRVRDLLEHVSDALALEATVDIVEEGREIRATLEGEDLGLFIGRHGQTIDAVQHLAFKTATRDQPPSAGVRVVVDAAGYRERRELALQRQADEAAADAVRSKRPVALDAMSATERKVVHEYLKDRDDVETYSEGTEPDRHLVVAPCKVDIPSAPPRSSGPERVSRETPRRGGSAARGGATGRHPRAAVGRSDGVDHGPRPGRGRRSPRRRLSERAPAGRGRAHGSPTSAPVPAGRASRWPPRCPTRTCGSSRARTGIATTWSARSRCPA